MTVKREIPKVTEINNRDKKSDNNLDIGNQIQTIPPNPSQAAGGDNPVDEEQNQQGSQV